MTAAVKIEDLTKVFRVGFWGKRFVALQGLSFEVEAGEVFGLLGPNGAGKTTALKLLMGLIKPTRGRAWIMGMEVNNVQVRAKIGYLPESPYFYEHLRGGEFMDFYGRLFSLTRSRRRERSEELLALVGLARARDLPLRKYSKGMLQRIGLAQALINDPELVILDEPMTGLDPVGRREVRDVILQLKKQGKTVCFSSHILSDVEMICDRVGIINQGRMVSIGKISQLLNPRIEYYEISFSGLKAENLGNLRAPDARVFSDGDLVYAIAAEEENKDRIIAGVQEKGGRIHSVIPHRESLEEYFLRQVNINNAD